MKSPRSRTVVLASLLSIPVPALAQVPPPPAAPPPQAEEAKAPAFKIGGLMFGDYYDVAQNHRDGLEGQNGFWMRRLYLTYDHALAKSLSLRVRLEANSKGDFVSTGVNTPYIKDAWLKWAFGDARAHRRARAHAEHRLRRHLPGLPRGREEPDRPLSMGRRARPRAAAAGRPRQGAEDALRLSVRQRLRHGHRDRRQQVGAGTALAPLRERPRPRGLRRLAGPAGQPRRLDAGGARGLAGEDVARVAPVRPPGTARGGPRRRRPLARSPLRLRGGPGLEPGHPPGPSGPQLRSHSERRDDRLHALLGPRARRSSATWVSTSPSRGSCTSSRTSR